MLRNQGLDSQPFTAFGSARIDHGAATTGFHANQKAMCPGSACFGGLVCSFHGVYPSIRPKPCIIAVFSLFFEFLQTNSLLRSCFAGNTSNFCQPVDKFLIK
jgi:hypothetical protein